VVRLTGDGLDAVLARVVRPLTGPRLEPGAPRRVEVRDDGGVFDDGVAILRRGPRTATGQDLCEITVHGNPLVVARVVDACVAAGARVAQPGEFTRRAVLSGRLDLLAAEAVDQVIRATSPGGLALARSGADGRLSARIATLRDALVGVAAELEARLDHPGDDLAFEDDASLLDRLAEVARGCRELAETHAAGRALVEGLRVALVGPVNAGKSSLFNALVGRERALVHERPGTTRDVVEARARIGPLEVTLLDTAGERETDDPVEAAGLALAAQLVDEAELLLVVQRAVAEVDPAEARILERTAGRRRLVVYNGIDRPDAGPVPGGAIGTSARTGQGLDALRAAIVDSVGVVEGELLVASSRQRDVLLAIADAADEAVEALPLAGPAVAADAVTRGLEQVDVLTGADTREDVLDAVFARFCIGK
jgi:tRNA modification GTPase